MAMRDMDIDGLRQFPVEERLCETGAPEACSLPEVTLDADCCVVPRAIPGCRTTIRGAPCWRWSRICVRTVTSFTSHPSCRSPKAAE